MSRLVDGVCPRCGGDGKLERTESVTDIMFCPTCRGSGEVRKDVADLPREYCPWCDGTRPMSSGTCVECGSGG